MEGERIHNGSADDADDDADEINDELDDRVADQCYSTNSHALNKTPTSLNYRG